MADNPLIDAIQKRMNPPQQQQQQLPGTIVHDAIRSGNAPPRFNPPQGDPQFGVDEHGRPLFQTEQDKLNNNLILRFR